METTDNPVVHANELEFEMSGATETSPLLREFSEAQVEALRDEFSAGAVSTRIAGDGLIAASMKGVVAQLTECPMNWQ